ncbi:MAG: LysR family transcriptional regulator [Clostridia bacterium]|nr:LysR family transcriptional regulator [Clostridia bacterium]MBR2288681.1 LysR family transcriptional regulator [Clostridia bacterium]
MNFEQLLYAEVLSHHTSMQTAADLLHISKSGLSLAIGQLEEELGVRIFEKSSRGTSVTAEGASVLGAISSVLHSKNALMSTASALSDPQSHQSVSIRYMNTMFTSFITCFLGAFQEKYPNVFLDIRRYERDQILQAVRNQEIDAGFIVMPNNLLELGEGIRFTQVRQSRIALVCAPENEILKKEKITLEDLKAQKYCLFNDESHDYLFNQLQYLCGPLPLVMRSDDSWAMHEVIRKKNAVCFSRMMLGPLSREHTFDDLKIVSMGHLVDDHSNMGWVTNINGTLSPAASLLISLVTEEITKSAAE